MPDDEVVARERAWIRSGSPGDRAALLHAQVRRGKVSRSRLVVAAFLGDAPARTVLETSQPRPLSRSWFVELASLPTSFQCLCALRCARAVQSTYEATFPKSVSLTALLDACDLLLRHDAPERRAAVEQRCAVLRDESRRADRQAAFHRPARCAAECAVAAGEALLLSLDADVPYWYESVDEAAGAAVSRALDVGTEVHGECSVDHRRRLEDVLASLGAWVLTGDEETPPKA